MLWIIKTISVIARILILVLPTQASLGFFSSAESVLDGGEYKDPCSGGEHYTDVPEDPAETHQTSFPNQQEKQGSTDP